MNPWTFNNDQERREAVEWLENDAASLEQAATNYANSPHYWHKELAKKVKATAQHSAALARIIRQEIAA